MPNQNYTLLYYQENKIGFFSKEGPYKRKCIYKIDKCYGFSNGLKVNSRSS